MKGRLQLPMYTAAALTAANPVLLLGEIVYESDTGQRKVGNGVKSWNELSYESGGDLPAESILIVLGQPDTTSFNRTDDAALRLTKSSSSLIVEFFVTGNGASPSRAAWRNKLTSQAITWLNSVYNYGYNAGVSISEIGATGVASKNLSVSVLNIKAASNSIELYMEGINSASPYSLPFNFRTICSLK